MNYKPVPRIGVLEEVTETQIYQWKADGGTVHYILYIIYKYYISVYDVVNPNSVSTPLCLVTYSTLKNYSTGPSIN